MALLKEKNSSSICLHETVTNILLIVWIMALLVTNFIRNFYGVEITDEAFYVAETVSVIRGNVPYAYVMGRTAGFTFIMLPFVKVYSLLVPDLEGLFIYTRISFMVFRLAVIVISYRLLKNFYNKKYLIFILSLLIPISAVATPNFSYNTVSVWLFFQVGAVQLWGLKSSDTKSKYKAAVFSGVMVAFAELAHPGQILNVVWFGIIYLICYEKERFKCFFTYCGAGVITTVCIMIVLMFQTSPAKLAFGWETILKWTNANPASFTVWEQLQNMYESASWELAIFTKCIVIWSLVYLIQLMSKRVQIKKESKALRWALNVVRQIEFMDSLLLAVLICSVKLMKEGDAHYNPCYLGVLGVVLTGIVCAIQFKKREEGTWFVILEFMLFPFFYFIVTGLFTDTLAFYRLWQFIFCIIGFGILLEKHFKESRMWRRTFILISLSSVFLTLLYSNYNYVYREEPIDMLDTKVDKGVYKNIYTTSVKAKSLIELEEYVRENTQKEEKVLFMDLAPMAYFMSDAIPWTPSTWDRMQYSYGFNQPEIVYRYFQNRGDIPDKIIYIDSGRDECLSIDAEGYLFNDFVNENYTLTAEDNLNEMFSTKMYTLQDNINE